MLSLLDFKQTGIEDMLRDLQGNEKYGNACEILDKVRSYSRRHLTNQYGSVSVLIDELAEYLRSDVQCASAGTLEYLFNLLEPIQAQMHTDLSLYDLMVFDEMIENLNKISVSNPC